MPPAGYPAFLQYLQSGRVRNFTLGKVQRAGLGPGMAASFPCRAFWGVHLPLPKVCRIRDVICETDHLVGAQKLLQQVLVEWQ